LPTVEWKGGKYEIAHRQLHRDDIPAGWSLKFDDLTVFGACRDYNLERSDTNYPMYRKGSKYYIENEEI
jgi:hypothetical protein